MRKFIIVLLLASVFISGSFAIDLGDFPKGTWTDANWNAEWVFGLENIQLKDAGTGAVIFDFTEDKLTNFKLSPSTSGLIVSFTCKETERSYSFTKPMSLDTNIIMEINPDWTTENYKVTMPLKK